MENGWESGNKTGGKEKGRRGEKRWIVLEIGPAVLSITLWMCATMKIMEVFLWWLQLFILLIRYVSPNQIIEGVLWVSVPMMLVPTVTSSYSLTLAAFCVFEGALGVYWPTMSMLRASSVPEVFNLLECERYHFDRLESASTRIMLCVNHYSIQTIRSSLMAVFRIPLNIIVMVTLFYIGLSPGADLTNNVFIFSGVCLLLSLFCTSYLAKGSSAAGKVRFVVLWPNPL